MRLYVVVFEFLDAPQEQYRYLQIELTSLRAIRLTDTAYQIETEDTSAELTANLSRHLRGKDRLLVFRVYPDVGGENIRDVV
jgi:hypothetical protein